MKESSSLQICYFSYLPRSADEYLLSPEPAVWKAVLPTFIRGTCFLELDKVKT